MWTCYPRDAQPFLIVYKPARHPYFGVTTSHRTHSTTSSCNHKSHFSCRLSSRRSALRFSPLRATRSDLPDLSPTTSGYLPLIGYGPTHPPLALCSYTHAVALVVALPVRHDLQRLHGLRRAYRR